MKVIKEIIVWVVVGLSLSAITRLVPMTVKDASALGFLFGMAASFFTRDKERSYGPS